MSTPYLGNTTSISAAITNRGRELMAKSVLSLLSFQLIGFKVGQGGYDLSGPVPNPLVTTPVDPALTDLLYPIFPVVGYTPFVTIDTPFPNIVAPVCRLNSNECLYGLGEIGIWATILASSDIAYPIGTNVMFAVAHFPLKAKTDRDNFVFRVIIAL
jgi:hypothetical protein